MNFARLFADEIAFLKEVGGDFAAANPTLAPLLAEEGGDPDVRRLLEGFAFLTAKLRQRMDEDLPELLQDLIAVLAPQLLAPVPPMTTVEWLPRPRAVSAPQLIARGTKLRSRPVAGTSCRFTTCFDVLLAPLRIAGVTVDEGPRGATLRLSFEATEPMPLARLGLGRLRLHIAGGSRGGRRRRGGSRFRFRFRDSSGIVVRLLRRKSFLKSCAPSLHNFHVFMKNVSHMFNLMHHSQINFFAYPKAFLSFFQRINTVLKTRSFLFPVNSG